MRNSYLVTGAVLLTTWAAPQTQAPVVEQNKSALTQPCSDLTATPEHTAAVQLNPVRRIFVENFGEDLISKEMQSMIVSALVAAKQFKVTENRDRADAVLKGVALENTSQALHSYSEGTAIREAAINNSSTHTETLNEAKLSLRLVNADGDVIWTTTQESKGAKYKGASADVADMCIKQLLRDVAKLEGNTPPSSSGTVVQSKDRQSTK